MSEEKSIFKEAPELNYSEPAAEVSFDEFRKVVESRRSIRVFTKDPVPEDVVNKCIDMALLAPNSSNLQTWEFIWVRSADKKAKLAEACYSQPAATTAPVLIACVAHPKRARENSHLMFEEFRKLEASSGRKVPKAVYDYYKWLAPFVYTSGPFGILGILKKFALFFVGFFRVVPREPLTTGELNLWAAKSAALACENLMLAFRAAGYDTCPMEGYDSWRAKKVLGLDCQSVLVMVISAGKRVPERVYGPRMRLERDQMVKEL